MTELIKLVRKGPFAHTGDVFRDEANFYKHTHTNYGSQTMEFHVLDLFKDNPSVVSGSIVEVNGEEFIKMPFFNHIIDAESVKIDHEFYEPYREIVINNSYQMINLISELSAMGIKYNDPLQWAFDDKHNALMLIDFSNASKSDNIRDCFNENFMMLDLFFDHFGVEQAKSVFNYSLKMLSWLSTFSNLDDYKTHLESGRSFIDKNLMDDIKEVLRFKHYNDQFSCVYFSKNTRHIMLPHPGIVSNVAGREWNYIFTNQPLTDSEMRVWELNPIIKGYSKRFEQVLER
jgi:hypothetical protein